jgi:type IV fimbrial biogenesis protein FimT
MSTRRPQISRGNAGQKAFTLIELLVVLAIVAILATLAAPSFNELIKSQRIKTMASELNASLTLARSEAIKRNRDVTISPTTAGSWTSGWQIADPDNPGNNIEVHSAVTNLTVTGPDDVTYRSSGRISGATAPAFDISAPGTNTHRCVAVDLSGRPYLKSGAC